MEKTKTKTKKRLKIAFDLIQVYAKRKLKKGFQHHSDSYLQHGLEASFVCRTLISEVQTVKQDMESDQPMDHWFVEMLVWKNRIGNSCCF